MKRFKTRPLSLAASLASSIALFFALCGAAHADTIIDLLVVFDNTAKTYVDSTAGGNLNAKAASFVAKMNQSLVNSGLTNIQIRLAGTHHVNYTSQFDFNADLPLLRNASGIMSDVVTARDALNADLVTLMVDTGSAYGTTGLGYVLTSTSGNDTSAFSVCAIRAVETSNTMTHEIGHNMGLSHAYVQYTPHGSGSRAYSYGAGWYFPGNPKKTRDFYTIMAYNSFNGTFYDHCGLFSSPLTTHQGGVAGNANEGDAVRALSQTAPVVARYREPIQVQELVNHQAISGLSGASSSVQHFAISVPPGASYLTFKTVGGTGDADLHVRYGQLASTSAYDYRPYAVGNNETVTVTPPPRAGRWYAMLRAYSAFANLTLQADHDAPPMRIKSAAFENGKFVLKVDAFAGSTYELRRIPVLGTQTPWQLHSSTNPAVNGEIRFEVTPSSNDPEFFRLQLP